MKNGSNFEGIMATSLRWKIAQACELRWWKGYLKNKDKEDYLVWKKNYWNELLTKLNLSFKRDDTMVDLGCGPAGIFTVLDEYIVTAVDPLIDKYKETVPHFNPLDYQNTVFECATIEDFNSSKIYNVTFCINAINHVKDIDVAFDKLAELTADDGTLVISIDCHNHNFFKYLFRLIPMDILHPHQYDLKEYEQMLEKRGFKIEQTLKQQTGFWFDYYVLVANSN